MTNASKKKFCCCFAVIAEKAEIYNTGESRAVIRAAKGLLDVMFIKEQKQSLVDEGASLLEDIDHELLAPTPNFTKLIEILNKFSANIPID